MYGQITSLAISVEASESSGFVLELPGCIPCYQDIHDPTQSQANIVHIPRALLCKMNNGAKLVESTSTSVRSTITAQVFFEL